MAESDVTRKLTAILVTDVVGYSRLMGDDPEGTLKTLTEYREVFSDKITEYKGRVVNAPGDSILAEFVSVLDAVSCSVDIQRELAERNQELPDNRRMDFRIGVNLGDVLVKDNDLYGDGVNVAARLESLAEPGGICISGSVHEQVKTRLPLHYEFMGEQRVKNIAEPVKAYHVLSKPGAAAHRVVRAKRPVVGAWKKAVVAIVAVAVLAGGGFLGWNFYQQRATAAALAAFEKEASFPLPDRPSIAVLAFTNMSGDPEQEYFSDGISENIITKLAVFPNMFVIARTSSFKYRDRPVDIRQVGQELGVRYVLEGSVQRDGKRLRVTAQLIDAATGSHIFAKRYDRVQKDIFAVQDDITDQVLADLHAEIGIGAGILDSLRSTDNFDAYDAFLRGGHLYERFQKESTLQAGEYFKKAIELDPKFARAMQALGWAHMEYARRRWLPDPEKHFGLAAQWAQRAIATNPKESRSYTLMSRIHSLKGNHEKAIATGKRAVELSPNSAFNLGVLTFTYILAGEQKNALESINKALRLAPYPPSWFYVVAGYANSRNGRYEDAIREYKKALARFKGGPLQGTSSVGLIVSYMELEREEEARAEVEKLQQANPGYTIKDYVQGRKRLPYKDFSWLEKDAEFLRKAGLPD